MQRATGIGGVFIKAKDPARLGNPPGTMHSDINVGDQPIEVMVAEAKDDQ